MANDEKTARKWKIDDLHSHPCQSKLFKDLTDIELALLANDINHNGLEHPVEIKSNGEIIAGHQRVRAARLLRWDEIDVVVRDDLEAQGPGAILVRMIETNLLRRQLDPLSIARCVKELVEQYEHSSEWQRRQDMLEEIGQRLNLTSHRSVNRYLAVLRTPEPVQQAVDQRRLSIVQAGQVADLRPKVQKQIASRITGGENPRTVVTELLKKNRKPRSGLTPAYGPFVRQLRKMMEMLPGPEDPIKGRLYGQQAIELLDQAASGLNTLKKRASAKLRSESRSTSKATSKAKDLFARLTSGPNQTTQRADRQITSPVAHPTPRKRSTTKRKQRALATSKNKAGRRSRNSKIKSTRKRA